MGPKRYFLLSSLAAFRKGVKGSHSRLSRQRNFFFYHGFADLLRHILCPNLQFRSPLSILA